MKFKFSIVLFFIATLSVAQPQILDKVIAVVGKNPLLLSEVETTLLQQKENTPTNTKCKVFEDLLFQKLLLAQADRDSIVVSDNEIDGELTRRIQYYVGMLGSEEKFEQYYGKRISVFKDELRDDVKNQLLAQKMQQKITGDSKLTPNEVRTFYNSQPQDSMPLISSEVEIGQLVCKPPISLDEKLEVKTQLEKYRQRVLNGESMSVLAALYSEDPGSAKNGGRYESVMRGQMVPEFEAAAFKTKNGEVSEIFETTYGYHFLQVVARKGESVDLRHILMAPKTSQLDVIKARTKLDSLQKLIANGTLKFNDAALQFSDDKDTKQNGGIILNPQTNTSKWTVEELGQTDQNMVFILDKMQIGEVSPVMQHATSDGKQGWRIIQLKSRTEPHKANLKDDYTKLLTMATFNKQKTAMTDWITKKSKSTYIKIDNEFNSCKLEYNWVINP